MVGSRNGWIAAWALGLAGILASAPAARAEYFEFTTTPSITGVTTPSSGTTITSGTETVTQGTYTQNAPYAGVLINNSAGGSDNSEFRVVGLSSDPTDGIHENATGSGTNTVIAQFDPRLNVNSPANQPIDFNYSLALNLTDYSSVDSTTPLGSGSITITGRIQGTIGNGQVDVQNLSFATAPGNVLTTSNGTQYTISFSGFTPPGASNNGTLGIHIEARAVPEPGSLALLGMGGVGALGMFLRRRARA